MQEMSEWNPVKELKVAQVGDRVYSLGRVESGEGIESLKDRIRVHHVRLL